MNRRRQAELLTWPRLGAGLGAILAVGALLELLHHLISGPLDGNVTSAWVTARQLAQNTQALQHVEPMRERAAELVEELERAATPTRGKAG